jgi:hypothetical protein
VGGGNFNATYTQTAADGSTNGALIVSAGALMPNMDTAPGYISGYALNWSNGSYQFGVYSKTEQPLSRDQLVAIAAALDPSFDVSKLTEQPADGGVEPMPAPMPKPADDTAASPPVAAR